MSSIKRGRVIRRERAFSLIEIMIVLVIIAIMAGTVTVSVAHYVDKARQTRVKTDITAFVGAVDGFYSENGRYPTNDEGLAVLAPKYINKVMVDPWNRPYQYIIPGKNSAYEVICYGADGKEGGSGADADITNQNLDKQETAAK